MKERGFTFTLGETAGFCWGVERAIHGAKGKQKKVGQTIFVLGDLVHNRAVVDDLAAEGIVVTNDPAMAKDSTVVITAHGKDPKDIAVARTVAHDLLDMTCPIVEDVHRAGLLLQREGRRIILIGMRTHPHPEVAGIVGTLGGEVVIVESVADVTCVPYASNTPIGVIMQTTFNAMLADEIYAALAQHFPDARFMKTICDDIARKQEELRMQAPHYDAVIVVGDARSANSRHLADIARELGKQTQFVSDEAELRQDFFDEAQRVFVTAGASTPPRSIESVVAYLTRIGGIKESDTVSL